MPTTRLVLLWTDDDLLRPLGWPARRVSGGRLRRGSMRRAIVARWMSVRPSSSLYVTAPPQLQQPSTTPSRRRHDVETSARQLHDVVVCRRRHDADDVAMTTVTSTTTPMTSSWRRRRWRSHDADDVDNDDDDVDRDADDVDASCVVRVSVASERDTRSV